MGSKKEGLSSQIEAEKVPSEETPKSLSQQIQTTKIRQKSYVMDLRIHSPASLGYLGIEGIDTAPALVRLAKTKGLDVIAVTDFYSGNYIDRIVDAAKGTSLVVIPGVDLRCAVAGCDDVIISCLFPETFSSEAVSQFLAALNIPASAVGDKRYVVKEQFTKILELIDQHGGVALPSRMDKTPHRMSAIPTLVEQYGFRAFDLAYGESVKFFRSRWPKIKFSLFSFSNANALAQVGSRIAKVKMNNPGFDGIRRIVGRDNRVGA